MLWIQKLEIWYQQNQRPLPWRITPDPYFTLLSEVMSQQTTMTAILPYFKRFTERFPDINTLASADLPEVLQLWAGLGYPARARNLHHTAQWIHKNGFPHSYQQWIERKGIGPYTAAAIASIAFNERVGVVDGNVIRVASRFLNKGFEHWKTKDKKQLQIFMNQWIQEAKSPANFNQAIMELGALICTKTNPKCLLCPIQSDCQGQKNNNLTRLPLSKPLQKTELWQVTIQLFKKNHKFATQIIPATAPFLKGYPFFIHQMRPINRPPSQYHFIHHITHHKIYVTVDSISNLPERQNLDWLSSIELKQRAPFSIIDKVFQQGV